MLSFPGQRSLAQSQPAEHKQLQWFFEWKHQDHVTIVEQVDVS